MARTDARDSTKPHTLSHLPLLITAVTVTQPETLGQSIEINLDHSEILFKATVILRDTFQGFLTKNSPAWTLADNVNCLPACHSLLSRKAARPVWQMEVRGIIFS